MENQQNVKHRLPKGIQLSVQCQAIDFSGKVIETAETKKEAYKAFWRHYNL